MIKEPVTKSLLRLYMSQSKGADIECPELWREITEKGKLDNLEEGNEVTADAIEFLYILRRLRTIIEKNKDCEDCDKLRTLISEVCILVRRLTTGKTWTPFEKRMISVYLFDLRQNELFAWWYSFTDEIQKENDVDFLYNVCAMGNSLQAQALFYQLEF